MSSVTVWLSSYNHEKFLRESIDSILNQTFPDFELYIKDDASSDHSWEIIQSYRDPRIHTILAAQNRRGPTLRNYLDEFTAPYVAIAHSDDKWLPDKLEKQVAYLDDHPEMAACFTQVQIIDDSGKKILDDTHPFGRIFARENRDRISWLRFFFDSGNCLCHPSVLIRKEAYQNYDLFSHGLSGLPDFYQWVKLVSNAPIYIYPKELCCFRSHGDDSNTSAPTFENESRHQIELYQAILPLFLALKKKDFLAVFPEAKVFDRPNGYLQQFAYAQILLKQPPCGDIGLYLPSSRGSWAAIRSGIYLHAQRTAKCLYGLDLISDLFQNEETISQLVTVYDYDIAAFSKHKKQYAVFGQVPKVLSTLSVDFGEGFLNKNKRFNEIPCTGESTKLVYKFPGNIPLRGVRFCPLSGRFCRAQMSAVWKDLHRNAEIQSTNANLREDGWYIFLNEAPVFLLNVANDGKELEITVRVELLIDSDILCYANKASVKITALKNKKYSLTPLRNFLNRHQRLKKIVRLLTFQTTIQKINRLFKE